jgi:hypothetical protein
MDANSMARRLAAAMVAALIALAAPAVFPAAAWALPPTGLPPPPPAPRPTPAASPTPGAAPTAAPAAATITEPVFPITASQFDSLTNGTGGQMKTDVSIGANGALTATTSTHEMTMLHGFTGGVSVMLTDDRTVLWVSPVHYFNVDGTLSGHSDRTDTWSENVPAALLPAVRGVAIVHIAKAPDFPGAVTVGELMHNASALVGSAVGHAVTEIGTILHQIVGTSANDTAVGVADLTKIATRTVKK